MGRFQRSARISSPEVQRIVEAAGYVNFEETILRCCVSPWCDGTRGRLVANWFNVCLIEGIEAMSLAPLVEKFHVTRCQIKELQLRAYFNM